MPSSVPRNHADFCLLFWRETRDPLLQPIQGTRSDFVHAYFAHAVQHRQADGAYAGIKLGDTRTRGNAAADVGNQVLGQIQIVLTECTRRIANVEPAETLDHRSWTSPTVKIRSKYCVGLPDIRVEPKAVQVAAQAFAYQVQTSVQRICSLTIRHQHHLCRLRTA